MALSEKIIGAVRNARDAGIRQYQLANTAGVHPTVLSAWMRGIYDPRPGDPRVIRLAQLLGVPADHAFSERDRSLNDVELRTRL